MNQKSMKFTLWDVGHGLSIWIKTPSGHNHWIDAGNNTGTDFHPPEHVYNAYGERDLDYLIVTHPDSDHIQDLPSLVNSLGEPRVLCRNASLPSEMMFGDETADYQKVYKYLVNKLRYQIPDSIKPSNPDYNGGIEIKAFSIDYIQGYTKNRTSVITFYLYAGWLFIIPGDIDDIGWTDIWNEHQLMILYLQTQSKYRILVAPHHGRTSGYSKSMFDILEPHLTLISDSYGDQPTDDRFRTKPSGLPIDGQLTRYVSTKTGGRIQFNVYDDGKCTFSQAKLGE